METKMTVYTNLVTRLREHAENMYVDFLNEAADAIELLQRELKCANELWEQQKELALEYLADIEKANERIDELEKELDKHRQALVFIQMKAQDILRPIPFQEDDDEN
jgi:chromosome segregation ATPase